MRPNDKLAAEALRRDLDRARADLRAARARLAASRPEPAARAPLRREVVRYELRVEALTAELDGSRE
jgi:hypothetical protein